MTLTAAPAEIITEAQIEEWSHQAAAWSIRKAPNWRFSYDELRQEARCAIWEAAKRWDAAKGANLKPWCCLSAAGHLANYIYRRDAKPMKLQVVAEYHAPLQVATCELEQAIMSLEPKQRSVITYLYIGGLTLAETGKLMGLWPRSVVLIRDAALKQLRPFFQ